MNSLFGEEYKDTEPTNPTYARARELFFQVDENGDSIYTLEEIKESLRTEGYDVLSKSTLSRLSTKWGWVEKREALIRKALTNKEFTKQKETEESIGSIIDLAEHMRKTAKINRDGLDVLDNWMQSLSEQKSISEKEAATVVRVVEATGKMYEEIIKKIGDKENAKATANEVVKLLNSGKVVDVEII